MDYYDLIFTFMFVNQGQFEDLLDDTVNVVQRGRVGIVQSRYATAQEESVAQAYNFNLLSGRIRQAAWRAMIHK